MGFHYMQITTKEGHKAMSTPWSTVYKVTIKDTWLEACGLNADWKELDGTMRQGPASGSPMGPCFDVTGPDGRPWVVFGCRLVSFAVKGAGDC